MANSAFYKGVFDDLATDGCIGLPNGQLAFAYIRVSIDDQAEEGRSGLPRQIEHIHEVAYKHGYRIPFDHVFADDYSGFEFEDRPQLTLLRRELRSSTRRASVVVMEHLDRLSRNADWHQGFLLDEMKRLGVQPIFWKAFSSRIERAVLGAVSQEGMEQAKERMKKGNLMKAQSGRVTARRPAHGYKIVDAAGQESAAAKKDSYYAIDDKTAPTIRYIYTRIALDGITASRVAKEMDELSSLYPPPKNMKYWTQSMVTGIVKNPVYKGEFVANRWKVVKEKRFDEVGREIRIHRNVFRPKEEWIIVPVPAIVSTELWELANEMLEKNRRMAKRNARAPFLLTGLVKCAYCGLAYIGAQATMKHKEKTYLHRSYRCLSNYGVHSKQHDINCPNSGLTCHYIDDAVWFVIQHVLLDPETVGKVLEPKELLEQNQRIMDQLEFLDRAIAERDTEDEKLYRAYLADAFDEEEFAARRRGLREARETLTTERAKLQAALISPEEIEARKAFVLSVVEQVRQNGLSHDAPFEVKQRIIKMLVDKIVLDVKRGEFCVEGHIRGVFNIDIENTSAP